MPFTQFLIEKKEKGHHTKPPTPLLARMEIDHHFPESKFPYTI